MTLAGQIQAWLAVGLAVSAVAAERFNVREFGAKADGRTLDTAAIQAALDQRHKAGGGPVLFPAGRYLSGTIRLRSGVTLQLEAGARLIGTTNLAHYAQPTPPEFMPEAKWGKWHRALIVAENAEDIGITGNGVIDGNRVFDATGEERMRGPHTIAFVNCRRFTLRDVTIVDSANYAVFFQVSDDVEIRNVKFVGGWDGVHWRGAPERWCHNVKILGCQFFTGDDAIAGRYWNDTIIKDCVINSSCNGIRLIGPATRLTIANNLFRGPGEQPHRTSGERRRTNMLSGIILQPGAWDSTKGPLDDVFIANNVMQDVASPVTLWTKPGNTVGRVAITGLAASGVYRAALSAESWTHAPIANVALRDVQVEFTGGGKGWPANQVVKGPGVDARPLPAWGFYARNVQNLTLEDVRFSLAADDFRPVLHAEGVERLTTDNFRFPLVAGVKEPIVTTNASQRTETHAASAVPRGYSIPVIDLASETNRQVIVDREPGQYLGHPTTVLLEDEKTILCVYPKGHGKGALVLKRSADGGRTWSERLPVPENWSTSKETPTIHRVVDANGRKRLVVWSGLYPARLAVSEDDGATWTPLREAGDWGGVVVMSSVERLNTGAGHYMALFHDDGRFMTKEGKQQKPIVFTLYKTLSTDGGLTWSKPQPIYAASDIHLCEPGLVRSPDGKEMAVLLRENARRRNSHIIFSRDEGKTWTQPRELPGALTGDRHVGKYAPDGRLFISFRDTTHESKTQGDWVAWVGTYDDLVHNREGHYRIRLMDNHHKWDCAYPGVELLPDGTFVTTTYGHWTPGQPPYVVSVRLQLAELDARVRK